MALLSVLLVFAVSLSSSSATPHTTHGDAATIRPVVLLHGLFGNRSATAHIAGWLKEDYPGIYVHNADIPTQTTPDAPLESVLISMNRQVDLLAAQIAADPHLADGFDLICHSQGGLTCRGYIQRYGPKVHQFISLGGPQAGIFGVPVLNALCPDVDCPQLIDWMNKVSEGGWAEPLWQNYVSFAQYWRNPFNVSAYLDASAFLADINNERAVKNATYKQNLVGIGANFTMVMALKDEVVVPKESEHWSFYETGQDVVLVPLNATPQYTEDWLGLQTMNRAQRLHFFSVPCDHLGLVRPRCKNVVYGPIIKPQVGGLLPSRNNGPTVG